MPSHILVPRGHYIGQVRRRGARQWRTVTSRCQTGANAMALAVKRMKFNDTQARSLFIDNSGWFDPNVVLQATI